MSILILIVHVFQLPLTSGGGLAGVDMADDDDVDMSLFLTIMVKNMSEMIIDIVDRFHLRSGRERRLELDLAYPMVAVVCVCFVLSC